MPKSKNVVYCNEHANMEIVSVNKSAAAVIIRDKDGNNVTGTEVLPYFMWDDIVPDEEPKVIGMIMPPEFFDMTYDFLTENMNEEYLSEEELSVEQVKEIALYS